MSRDIVDIRPTAADSRGSDRGATRGPGEVVGEIGLLDETTRSATVTAIDELVIARRIGTREFAEPIVRSAQIYSGLVRLMSARLRNTDDHLMALVAGRA